MARANVEQHPATGATLVVMVGLSIAFLLFIAFLNVVKSGNILSEANLLYAALVFYAGAGALISASALPERILTSSSHLWPHGPASSPIPARWHTAGMRPAIPHSPASMKCC